MTGYIPQSPPVWIEVTTVDSIQPEYVLANGNAQRSVNQEWPRTVYDPRPVLRQAMVGTVILLAFVVSAVALFVSLIWPLVAG